MESDKTDAESASEPRGSIGDRDALRVPVAWAVCRANGSPVEQMGRIVKYATRAEAEETVDTVSKGEGVKAYAVIYMVEGDVRCTIAELKFRNALDRIASALGLTPDYATVMALPERVAEVVEHLKDETKSSDHFESLLSEIGGLLGLEARLYEQIPATVTELLKEHGSLADAQAKVSEETSRVVQPGCGGACDGGGSCGGARPEAESEIIDLPPIPSSINFDEKLLKVLFAQQKLVKRLFKAIAERS
jgi:hypothetical protein